MKNLALFAVIAFVSVNASAETANLRAPLLCGSYQSKTIGGTVYDSSKYALALGVSTDGVKRAATLIKIYGDGSSVGNYSASACSYQQKKITCSVGLMSVSFDPNTRDSKGSLVAEIKLSGLFTKTAVGTCKNVPNAQELVNRAALVDSFKND